MDLSKGFQIEEPNVFVPWDTSEVQFQQSFERLQLRRVTDGYFTTQCTTLSGLSHELGFHFYPRGRGRLVEFEFFRNSCPDLPTSYEAFQRHLEETFGPPTLTSPGSEGYLSHTWAFPGVEIVHYVQEHFGPAEYVRISKTAERGCWKKFVAVDLTTEGLLKQRIQMGSLSWLHFFWVVLLIGGGSAGRVAHFSTPV